MPPRRLLRDHVLRLVSGLERLLLGRTRGFERLVLGLVGRPADRRVLDEAVPGAHDLVVALPPGLGAEHVADRHADQDALHAASPLTSWLLRGHPPVMWGV